MIIMILFETQSYKDEAECNKKLLDLIKRKTNQDFDQFCEALHQTRQTHVVQHLLVTAGIYIDCTYIALKMLILYDIIMI